jgi:hypothetical protein
MSKKQKLTIRLLKVPKDFTWDELHAALLTLGFEEITNSKTCGSRGRLRELEKVARYVCKSPLYRSFRI